MEDKRTKLIEIFGATGDSDLDNMTTEELREEYIRYRNDFVSLVTDIDRIVDALTVEAIHQHKKAATIEGDKWLEGATRSQAITKNAIADRLEDIISGYKVRG